MVFSSPRKALGTGLVAYSPATIAAPFSHALSLTPPISAPVIL